MSKRSHCRIVTFHTPINYGAVLQAFSLFSYCKEKCEDTLVIDYFTPALRRNYKVLRTIKSIKDLIWNILHIPYVPCKLLRKKKFRAFVEKHISLTEKFESYSRLKTFDWEPNTLFITGSDQVFNPMRIEEERNTFYLSFVDSQLKTAYAASFGVEHIPEAMSDEIEQKLRSFYTISVRESSGVEIVNELTSQSVPEVLDPVFLHTKEFWNEYADEKTVQKYQKRNYVLYYRLLPGEQSDTFAVNYAKEKNIELVTISMSEKRWKHGEFLLTVDPGEFLALVRCASYIVTNSFHGVAFSLIYKKQFVFTNTGVNNFRGVSLLKKVGAYDDAYICNVGFDSEIDYNRVTNRLNDYLKVSCAYLNGVFQYAEQEDEKNEGDRQCE